MPGDGLCNACRLSLRRAPPRRIGDVVVYPGLVHTGSAARLVHNLKYRRCERSAEILGAAMVSLVPLSSTCVVPVPRSLARRMGNGIDQTASLAAVIGRVRGLPVVRPFVAPLWWRSRAGMDRERRRGVVFRARGEVPPGAVIVDDVVTSGSTLQSIVSLIPHRDFSVVTATAAGTMESRVGIAHARR